MKEKPANTTHPINELARRRWSPRAFDKNKPVSNAKLQSLCEAARWSPSSYNDQPWRFIICNKFKNLSAWEKMLGCLGEWNQKWAETAPVLVATVANDKFQMNGEANRWGGFDTGAAAYGFCLEATAQGLHTHQMGGFDADKIRSEFAVPDGFTPMSVIALGYIADIDVLPTDYHQQELADRVRNEMGKAFFDGHWDNPLGSE